MAGFIKYQDDGQKGRPSLTANDIRQRYNADAYSRGQSYATSGAVQSLRWIGDKLEAQVEGRHDEPYTVSIIFLDGRIAQSSCTCPIGGSCKHVVAALLQYIEGEEDVEELPDLVDLLAPLDREQLETILISIVEHHPELYDKIASKANMSLAQETVAGNNLLDAERFHTASRTILRSLRRPEYDEYYEEFAEYNILGELNPLFESIQELLDADRIKSALSALEAVTSEVIAAWDRWNDDDYGGGNAFSDTIDKLENLWIHAGLAANLPLEERAQWAQKLSRWRKLFASDAFSDARDAIAHAWDDPLLLKMLAGEDVDEEAGEWESIELYGVRLNSLKLQGRMEEALNLALATGQFTTVCISLITLGRSNEAVEYAMSHISTTAEILKVCQALWNEGAKDETLRLGEFGLDLPEDVRGYYARSSGFAPWVRDAAREDDRPELVLKATELAYEQSPSLADYNLIRDLTSVDWQQKQEALLQRLREPGAPGNEAVDIFLLEQLWDDAIDAAERAYSRDLLPRVFRVVMAHRPDRVFSSTTKKAEYIMNAGDAGHYDDAAEWLSYARGAYKATDRLPEWKVYLDKLLVTHGRKYKLVPMLRALA